MALKPILLIASLALATTVSAQFDPQGSQVYSYFPQLADGGSASQQWITSFTFVNPNATVPVSGSVNLYGNNGSALPLDFGAGPVSSFPFTIPPQGTVVFTTTGASQTVAIGWAVATSNLPVQGVVQYRYSVNGVPQQGVSALATEASALFRSPASATTGIAVANPSLSSLALNISAINASDGSPVNLSFDNIQLNLGVDPHGSFVDRIGVIFQGLQTVCLMPQDQPVCSMYKTTVHSHFPVNAPI